MSFSDNGKLDLSQIKSPKMKKRLMANMKDEEEQDENRIESIDASIQNNKNQDKQLDRELSSPLNATTNQQSSYLSDPSFSPSVQTKPSLVVPLSAFSTDNNHYPNEDAYTNGHLSNGYQAPILPLRQTSLNYDFNRPLSPDEKLDQILKEQLNRGLSPDVNNNCTPSFYDQNSSFNSKPQYYGNVKPKKINIVQELADERNFNCVPSQYNDQSQTNYNQTPKLWSNQNASNTSYPIPIEVQKDRSQYYTNAQQPNYHPGTAANNSTSSPYESVQSKQNSYQIPVINQNINNAQQTSPPAPPQRQQSLNRAYDEKEIPVQYEEPIQSRSFKILQKLTADIEDEIDKLKVIDQQNKATYQRDPLEGR